MKPTTEQAIELAREARLMSHIPFPSDSLVAVALSRFATLLLERFGAGDEESVAVVSIGKHPWNKGLAVVDLERPLRVGTKLYTHPSPTSDGNPTGYLVGHSGEYHYFRHKADAEREKAEQERCSGESCGDVEPVFRHPSSTDLRAEYLRGLDDAKRAVLDADDMGSANIKLMKRLIGNSIEALKGKQ